ncbi:uncharacterized protein K02A2.6-like [Pectinophora gossypiella]|uniref:uncharacterized protein K02A2.6-like n=1 Tax=Pectinophora gossypiella TaxID=13191 RepID=UPI00214F47BD|nr:uncharacterized protein K02A2.6-like [Pectinophora gossypiella]
MLAAGVVKPVDCSDWATPLVVVSKPDGAIRICADYKVTLNRYLSIDKFPVPKIDDLLTNLGGCQYFSNIDLSQAYNQIELDNDSKKYTVINTHRGLFMYNRLVFGLASSPGIFQRMMINLLGDIPNVVIFLDDVLIATETKEKHFKILDMVLRRLVEYGMKVKKEKCAFLVSNVKYLGYVIDKNGIRADQDKIKAIVELKSPRDVSELRSFIGMVNFYSRFIKNLSTYLNPLYNLLKKCVKWYWGEEQKHAFSQVKRLLSETIILTHYDGSRPMIVTCDASAHGLGAVLAQRDAEGRERPVACVSRALTPAELNYSQIQKEALAIVYAVKKFHQYLFARHFTLRTDHKPLVTIFGPHQGIPNMTSSRLQRWALILSAYNFGIEYVNTEKNVADALSRMLMKHKETQVSEYNELPEQTYLHFASDALLLDYTQIKRETANDCVLSRVLSYIRDGWPHKMDMKELQPFFTRKNELYEEMGCIMWGYRVVIPRSCTGKVLKELHDSHMGIVKTKQVARSYVWWPGLDEVVEDVCRACAVCASVADAPPAHTPRSWPWPARPWTRLHMDFLGPFNGILYFVTIDAGSKWIEISKINNTSAKSVIINLRDMFARFGLPKQIVSDNGPPFSSAEFSLFLKSNGIEHITAAPYHPASNGAAENAVKTCKKVIKKAYAQGVDVETALNRYLLMYRNTEHSTTGVSPAKLLQGRSLRTRLDCLKPERDCHVQAAQRRQERAVGGVVREFKEGAGIWYRSYRPGKDKWLAGKIVKKLGSTNYELETSEGTNIHRHVDQIRVRSLSSISCPPRSSGLSPQSVLVCPSGSADSGGAGGAAGSVAAGERPRAADAPDPALIDTHTRPLRTRRPPRYYGFEID